MNRISRAGKAVVTCLAVIGSLAIAPSRALADDFRIESKVFVGKETEPTSENLTLFRGAQVYDFLNKPNEITLFDESRGRVVLLDPARRVKAEIKADRLTAFSDQLRSWCGRQTDPFLKFAAEPRFEQTLDDASGELVFTSPQLIYRVATIKANTESIARQYRQFSDSYARLNALTNPGSSPPFPRLAMDDALFRSRLIPEKVQLTMPRQRLGGKTTSVRSEHTVNWRLLESDLQKIDEAGEFLVTFTQLPLEKYLEGETEKPRH